MLNPNTLLLADSDTNFVNDNLLNPNTSLLSDSDTNFVNDNMLNPNTLLLADSDIHSVNDPIDKSVAPFEVKNPSSPQKHNRPSNSTTHKFSSNGAPNV
ncbi:hypothetical protein GEMRC1_000754 [Eukaryota sp. GEM-RC1]